MANWWELEAQAEAKAAAELQAAKGENVEEAKPTFTKDELDMARPEADIELDEEARAKAEALRKLGADDAEIERHIGEQSEKVPAVSLASVERKLAALAELRRFGDRSYWSNENQEKERALIEQRNALKADKQTEAGAMDDVAAIAEGLDPDLKEEWARTGGVQRNLKNAQATAQAVLDDLEPEDAAATQEGFDALPDVIKTEAYRWMAIDAGNPKAASEESVADFAGIGDEAAALVRSWGSKAPQRLGAAYTRLGSIVDGLGEAEAKAAQEWPGALSPKQRAAVIKAMGV